MTKCEVCVQGGIDRQAVTKVWADNPFGSTESRYVDLCQKCANEWSKQHKVVGKISIHDHNLLKPGKLTS